MRLLLVLTSLALATSSIFRKHDKASELHYELQPVLRVHLNLNKNKDPHKTEERGVDTSLTIESVGGWACWCCWCSCSTRAENLFELVNFPLPLPPCLRLLL